jgi:hypothetical protein
VGALVWGALDYQELQNRLDALPRTTVPGVATIDVSAPQGMTVYYEDPSADGGFVVQADNSSTLRFAPVDVTVTGPSGQTIPTAPYETDLRFDIGDRVAVAMATFDAPTAGTYTITVAGDEVPAGARVSVGDVVDAGLIANLVGAIVLLVGTWMIALLMVVVVAVMRSRRPAADEVSERPLTHA